MNLKGFPGSGLLFALLLLGGVEYALHSEDLLYRYRAVFAAGRALDKMRYVEAHVPSTLIIGNSRVDNGFDPATVQKNLPGAQPGAVFNLGIPGVDTRTLYGILVRFAHRGLLGPAGIRRVVIGLDESVLQKDDSNSLGYGVFFNDRGALLSEGDVANLVRSTVRLWGFADNLKELREPAKLERFIQASRKSVDPVGGSASQFLGYRAGFGALQDAAQIERQEVGSKKPPDAALVRYLERCIDLLAAHDVEIAIIFPPLLNRRVLYLDEAEVAAEPYREIRAALERRQLPMIDLGADVARDTRDFINAGHLNDRGAQRFSALLGQRLSRIWATP